MTGKSALIIGATGQTGQHLLKELLASDYFTRVGEYGRRVTDAKDIVAGKDKLEQKVVDFEKIQPGEWKDGKWDVLFITFVASVWPDPFVPLTVWIASGRRKARRAALRRLSGSTESLSFLSAFLHLFLMPIAATWSTQPRLRKPKASTRASCISR